MRNYACGRQTIGVSTVDNRSSYTGGKSDRPTSLTSKNLVVAVAMVRLPNHVLGKRQIFEWAQRQGWQPQMEVYLKDIAQRPDVLANINGQRMALEFQCSPLAASRLQERNDGYHKLGIAVYWLLGPTYQRWLRPGMVSQFTQLCHGQPCLAFWRLDSRQITFQSNYYQPRSRSMNQRRLLEKQVRALRYRMKRVDKHWQPLVNRAYLAGHQLSACPLVAHPTRPQWPLLQFGELHWRLRMLLQMSICQTGMSWKVGEWQQWLISQGNWLPTPCLSALSRRQLMLRFVDVFTADLKHAGVVATDKTTVQLLKQPQWFRNDAVKEAFIARNY